MGYACALRCLVRILDWWETVIETFRFEGENDYEYLTESFIRVFNTRIKLFKNDQIWPILQQKTIPIVFELDPLFLIRDKNCTP